MQNNLSHAKHWVKKYIFVQYMHYSKQHYKLKESMIYVAITPFVQFFHTWFSEIRNSCDINPQKSSFLKCLVQFCICSFSTFIYSKASGLLLTKPTEPIGQTEKHIMKPKPSSRLLSMNTDPVHWHSLSTQQLEENPHLMSETHLKTAQQQPQLITHIICCLKY